MSGDAKVQIVSPLTGYYSFATVGRAIAHNLHAHGFEVIAYDYDPREAYTDLSPEIRRGIALADEDAQAIKQGCVTAPEERLVTLLALGLVATNPGAQIIPAIKPRLTLAYFVCEADRVALDVIKDCARFDVVMVPSTWALAAFRRSGINNCSLLVPHGIDEAFRLEVTPPRDGQFRFLHFCTSLSAPERKGTPHLLKAFQAVFGDDEDVELVVRTPADLPQQPWEMAVEMGTWGDNVRLERALGLPPVEQAALYRSYDVIVQPSLAEGWGLIPLEARACGIPVIMSDGTGHADHVPDAAEAEAAGVVLVPNIGYRTHDMEYGRWMDIQAGSLEISLRTMHTNYAAYRQAAMASAAEVQRRWSWDAVLAPLRKMLGGT